VGTGGATGTGGAIAADCANIAAAYDREMATSKMCGTTGGILGTECKSPVPARLGCGSECFTYVDSLGRLQEIYQQWSTRGCPTPICTAVACRNPTGAKCVAAGLSLSGTCTDLF